MAPKARIAASRRAWGVPGSVYLSTRSSASSEDLNWLRAAIALAKKGNLEAVTALTASLAEDAFWGVRAEVAEQLASVKLDQAVEGLLKGLNDPEARVRRAVVESLGDIKTAESYKALKSIAEKGDPSYYVEAAAIRSLGKVGAADLEGKAKDKKTLKLLESILKERQGWNETVRSGAIAALSQFKSSEEALELVLKYTEPGTPQALRLAAIRSLGAISKGQSKPNVERILDRLDAIAHESFFLTQVSAVSALGTMEASRAISILQSLADHTPDGRVRRRAQEAVRDVQKAIGKDQAVEKLRQELDDLKKSNQELKSRLETLEAKAK
jgi:aminopeptidase N